MVLSLEWQNSNHVDGGGNDFCNGEQSPQRSSLSTALVHQETHVNLATIVLKEASVNEEQAKGVCIEEPSSKSIQVNLDGGGVLKNKDDHEFHQAPSCNTCNKKDKFVPNSGSSYCGVACPSDKVVPVIPEESFFCNITLEGKSELVSREKADYEQIYLCSTRCNETHLVEAKETHDDGIDPLVADQDGDVTTLVQRDLISEREKLKETDEYKRAMEEEWASRLQQLQIQAEEAQRLRKRRIDERHLLDMQRRQKQCVEEDVTPSVQRDLISEREKLKETDEYKRAIEEEWASRLRQLQIQAKEAQRLRSRRRAEKRLLDMQMRQKQRVEEVRETQKKEVENMNLKEQLRVEIRKELDKLETTDMASLLGGLGIELGGDSNPLPHEVQTAYKKAVLKFHPDRASKSDIRQQVEAEEKFKLISRMNKNF